MTDYAKVFLSQYDIVILNTAAPGVVVNLHPVEAKHLLSLGFIAQYATSDADNKYVITPEGLLYMEFYNKQTDIQAQTRADVRFSKRISVLALLVSIGSLIVAVISLITR